MTEDTGTNTFEAMQRTTLKAGLGPLTWGSAMGRMVTNGTVAALEGQATATRQGTELLRQTIRTALEIHARTVPGSEADDEAFVEAFDEAMDALADGGAESLHALARDIKASSERAESARAVHQELVYEMAAAMLEVQETRELDEGPIQIEVGGD